MQFSIEELEQKYPALHQLIGYFHQDWNEEYGNSPEAAIDDYIAATGDDVEAAAAEIDQLLVKSSNEELTAILRRLDNNYNYESDGYTARTWLEAIRDRLRTQ